MMNQEQLSAAVSDLALAVGQMLRRMRAASESHELSLSQRATLAHLANEGAATISDLARAECVKPQSMGATVAMLEEMGLAERTPHPTDGRQVLITITDKGKSVREEMRAAKRNWLLQAVTELDDQEQATLFAAGKIIERMVRK